MCKKIVVYAPQFGDYLSLARLYVNGNAMHALLTHKSVASETRDAHPV